MEVRIKKLNEKAVLPEYQTEHAAAMDIHTCLDEPIVVAPLQRFTVPTGLAVEIPFGYEMQIRARSGMSIKYGITIEPGMRVAQMLVQKYEKVTWQLADELSETERGEGGFGSTGFIQTFDKKA